MATKCKCYCFFTIEYMVLWHRAATFSIWLTWNWNIAEFSKLLVAALGFPKPYILYTKTKPKTKKMCTHLALVERMKKKKITAIEITWGEWRRCKSVCVCVLILYSKKSDRLFFLLFLILPYHSNLLTTWATYETDPLLILCVKGSEFVSTQNRLSRICTRFSFSFSLC